MNEAAFALRPRPASDATAIQPLGQPGETTLLHAAEQAYRRLLAVQPHHLRTLCGLAVVRHPLGATGDARMLLGQAAEIGGHSSEEGGKEKGDGREEGGGEEE